MLEKPFTVKGPQRRGAANESDIEARAGARERYACVATKHRPHNVYITVPIRGVSGLEWDGVIVKKKRG